MLRNNLSCFLGRVCDFVTFGQSQCLHVTGPVLSKSFYLAISIKNQNAQSTEKYTQPAQKLCLQTAIRINCTFTVVVAKRAEVETW